jgi:hypothetical protein
VLAAALACAPAHAAGISFCLDKANPMFATDKAVANAVAQAQNLTPTFVLRDSSHESTDDDDLTGRSQVRYFTKLAAQCDVIMGFPVEAGFESLPDGMAASLPYARTGFVIASSGASAPSFSAAAHSSQVGVVIMTVASTYFDSSTMTHEHVYYSNDQLYGALKHGDVDAALIWQPWLNQQLVAHPQKLHVAALNMPHAAWNIVALYPQTAQNTAAVQAFNNAVGGFAANGQLSHIVQPYDIPETEH